MNAKQIPYEYGLWIFGGYVATRLLVVILCIISLGVFSEVTKGIQSLAESWASIVGEVLAGGAAFGLTRKYFEVETNSDGKFALGLTTASRRNLLSSTLGGFALAASVIVLEFIFPTSISEGASALDKYTMNGGAVLYSWLLVGILVAPCVEELLFRGVLFSIIKSHSNAIGGTIGSMTAFMLIHIPQAGHDWKSALAILTLGLICTVIRASGMSLWLAVTTHASYNAYLTIWAIIHSY